MSARTSVETPGVLTFLIADIRGYTTFTQARGDEAAARLAAAFAEVAREGVEARGGTVIELRGDEALATFTSPRQAIRAATELQLVFADETARDPEMPLNVGIGLDVGEAVPVEGGYRGGALNLAARLCSVARGGEILASEALTQLAGGLEGIRVEAHEPLTLKGMDEPVRASRVVAVHSAGKPLAPSAASLAQLPIELDPVTALAGHEEEARRSRWAWRLARRGPGRTLVIGGPTGIGKTRIAAEPAALARRDGAAVSYASALGPGGLRPGMDALRDVTTPRLVVFDDLESASSEDLAMLVEAADTLGDRPVLLLALVNDVPSADVARAARHVAPSEDWLRLGPLREAAISEIVATYAADAAEPAPVWAIAEASSGLPAQVHALASDWARREVSRRLGGAVSRAAEGRRDLRRLEAEVASNVVDLQLARERLELSTTTRAADSDQSPFKGLVAFDVADADLFFGRERLVAEMIGRLAGSWFLGVVGPSGSGKSSVVRAGLIPALSGGAVPGAEAWTRAVLRPGAHPMRELDRVLFAALPPELRDGLSATPNGAAPEDPLAAAARVLGAAARPLVVVDQFEEIFTTTADPVERDRFVEVLVRAARSGEATVVVAVRADFYGRCATYPGLAELLGEGHVLVGPMTAEEYRRAIEGPARRAGLQIDPALVDALVAEVVDEPGALPLLSTALLELWQQREGRAIRLSAYAATGGVHGAVGRLAEAAFARLDGDEQQVARGLFLRLASGEGDAVVRRRVPLAELDASENERVRHVVSVLTEARLLTVGEGTVEVAHEALLREWPRLTGWLEEDRAGRRLREHLIASAQEWATRDRDPGELYRGTRLAAAMDWTADHTLELNETERSFLSDSREAAASDADRQRRTNRRLRALLGVAAIALVVAVGAGVLALAQRGEAEHASIVADAQRLGAQALIQTDLDLSLLLARQGVAMEDDTATRANLLSAIVRSPAAIGAWRPVAGRPLGVEVSPDGRYLLIGSNQDDVALVDAATGRVVRDVGHAFAVFTSQGTIAHFVFDDHPRIEVSTVADPTVRQTIALPTTDQNFSFAPDLSTTTTVDTDRLGITQLDSASGADVRHLAAPPDTTILDVWQYAGGAVLAVDHPGIISDPADLQAAFGADVHLDYYPAGAAEPSASIPASGGGSGSWAVDQRATEIAVPEPGGTIGIYDLPGGHRRDLSLQHTGLIGMTFSPDGATLVTAGDDQLMKVWDATTGQLRETLAGHNGRVFAPALSDAGGHLTAWSVSLDAQLIEWDLTGDRRLDRPFHSGPGDTLDGTVLGGLTVSPDGRWVAATGGSGEVDVMDATTLAQVARLDAPAGGKAFAVAFSPDSQMLAVAGQGDAPVQRWAVASWTRLGTPLAGLPATVPPDPSASPGTPPGPNAARAVAFSPDGHLVAAGTEDGSVGLWDAATGAPAGDPLHAAGPVFAVAFSPDSASLAATFHQFSPSAGSADVWALTDRALRYTVSVDDDYGAPFAIAFSPDGKLLATGGGIGYVRFWDAATGVQAGRSVLANAGWVVSLAFTSDGSTVVTAGTDGTVRLVDVPTRQQYGSSLPGGVSDSFAVLSPDAKRVFALYADDGHGYAWDISLAGLEAHACSVAGRTLTADEWARFLPDRPYAPACSGG